MGAEGVDPIVTTLQARWQTHQPLIIIWDETRPCLNRIMGRVNAVPSSFDMVVASYIDYDFWRLNTKTSCSCWSRCGGVLWEFVSVVVLVKGWRSHVDLVNPLAFPAKGIRAESCTLQQVYLHFQFNLLLNCPLCSHCAHRPSAAFSCPSGQSV